VTLVIPYGDPLAALAAFADDPFVVLFDSADRERGRFTYLCARPRDILTAGAFDTTDAFRRVEKALGPKRPTIPDLPPFQGGAAGFFAYDLAHQVERLPRHQPDDVGLPAMAVGLFDAVVAWDHAKRRAWVIGADPAAAALAETIALAPAPPPLDWSVGGRFRADLDAADYRRRIARVIADIHAGEVFQTNLSQRFTADRPAGLSPFTLYRRLRALSPAPFAAFLKMGEAALLSASPERFLAATADGAVETRPIKGTRPRGGTREADRRLAAELLASDKDRAENLMIVDLLRNDLSRVCRPGSISVPRLWDCETHPTMHHLVSTVLGQLAEDKGPLDLLRAAFPGGSISGAPKVRAMEIIAELEPVRRGPYCGALGWVGYDGAMDSAIAIRTLVMTGDKIYAQAGGGIVANSEPDSEYAETLTKAAALLASLEIRQ